MKLLLDSCVFLWMIDDQNKIPHEIKQQILSPLNQVYLSSISITEIIIKAKLKKLHIPKPHAEFLISQRQKAGLTALALQENDLISLEKLPDIHHDPFDQLLICQAINNNMTIISPDLEIKKYSIHVIW